MSSSVSLKTFLNPRYWYAWPVLALMVLLAWMPRRVLWILGRGLGTLISWIPSSNRRYAERNLELCFPEFDQKARHELIKTHFQLFGYATLALGVAWFAPPWRIRKFVALRGWENLETQYAAGRNVILLTPHFIGLDIAGMRISVERDAVSMYRKARDPLMEYLFQRRTRYGGMVTERSASLKPIIRSIKEGKPFYYLPDQDMGEKLSVFVPFFGIPAATITMLSRLAQTTNAAVVPCIARLLPHGGAEAHFLPALENFPTDDPVADAARMNLEIEKWVRQMPEQYLWTYRRFKTRPNNEPSLYSKK
jgi:KDO2-lipid IV(A) lauroyltransferase